MPMNGKKRQRNEYIKQNRKSNWENKEKRKIRTAEKMSNFRLDSRAVLIIFSQKHFDLHYQELKSFLFLPLLSLSFSLARSFSFCCCYRLVPCTSYSRELLCSAFLFLSSVCVVLSLFTLLWLSVLLLLWFYVGIIGWVHTQ